jgi:hypothetical protein
MRFDTWTKDEKQMLDFEYKQLFADQVVMLKKLYRFKSDQNLCNDILDNIANTLFKLFEDNQFEFAESLIERMFLAMMAYDVMIYKQRNFEDYKIDVYFYDQNRIYRYKYITITGREDLKKMIEMMLYIGLKYDQLSLFSVDTKDITPQQLILGFDDAFIKNKMTTFFKPNHIQ